MIARESLLQVARFGLVGIFLTALYFALFQALQAVPLAPPAVNSAAAFSACVVIQYCAHGAITFNRGLADRAQMKRFATVIVSGLVLSTVLVGYVGPVLQVSPLVSSLMVVVVVPVFNYVLFKLWAFAPRANLLDQRS